MTATLTIQNADKTLIDALKSVIRLHPQAKVTVRSRDGDGFYSEENISYLEELKRLDDAGKLTFAPHELIEA